ncbi:hypothetical protein QBC33DRAFT_619113 [Phialemonium atrogriseum]|uniref:MYND-type domain-containing protein n=1 Tax=Phialemonium atrogriseum TaxID=1093897 RepID=A0AAJ0FHZ8_9PEZI|nr:uncharacterized protein QBC33DRAFT_619113 [Phialemonium atrogriseum]KAK1768267.1 hypothetical protein QBC33DRAFT_619113 [Phialemonium atrogriseum]
MGPEPCSAPSCTKPGARACTGCTTPPPARYCSQECQKRDWKTHTSVCGGRRYNGFMITNTPFEQTTSSPRIISDYLTPFYFQRYGHEGEERRELEQRLGWREVAEVGKFYDHEGSDTWYYYVYGPGGEHDPPLGRNEIATLCIGVQTFGDVVVVRSGPLGSSYPPLFSKGELVKTVEFSQTANPREVFQARECSRFMRSLPIGIAIPPGAFFASLY